jgi:hypothetical protein
VGVLLCMCSTMELVSSMCNFTPQSKKLSAYKY